MAERLDPELRKLLRWLYREDGADLADLLRTRSDPRGDDVLEFVQGVECDPRIERGRVDAPYVVAAGEWWTIRCLANGVSAYLHPRTEQRGRSERYGRVGMTSPFVPVSEDYLLRERAAFEGREVTQAELEALLADAEVTAEEVREHLETCLAGLITLQFGWEPRELANYDYIVNLEHRTETAAAYDVWLDSEPCLLECEVEGWRYQFIEEITNPALPVWMEDLYRGNPGRFWWLMRDMVNSNPLRREAAGRVLDRLTGVGLISPGSLPDLLKDCFAGKASDEDADRLLGSCCRAPSYTQALRWARDCGEPGWMVVHGTIRNGRAGKRIGHAWCERGGFVADLTLAEGRRVIEQDLYYRALKPKGRKVYRTGEAILMALKTRHDGPWDESERLKA